MHTLTVSFQRIHERRQLLSIFRAAMHQVKVLQHCVYRLTRQYVRILLVSGAFYTVRLGRIQRIVVFLYTREKSGAGAVWSSWARLFSTYHFYAYK